MINENHYKRISQIAETNFLDSPQLRSELAAMLRLFDRQWSKAYFRNQTASLGIYSHFMEPLMRVLVKCNTQDDVLVDLCLKAIGALLSNPTIAKEQCEEGLLVPLLIKHLDHYLAILASANTEKAANQVRVVVNVLLWFVSSYYELGELLVSTHNFIPKILPLLEAESPVTIRIKGRVNQLLNLTIFGCSPSSRKMAMKQGIVRALLPHFPECRSALVLLIQQPDAFEFYLGTDRDKLVHLCQTHLNIAEEKNDLESLYILSHLNPNGALLKDVALSDASIKELSRIIKNILTVQEKNPKDWVNVSMPDAQGNEEEGITMDLQNLLKPLACLAALAPHRTRLFSNGLTRMLLTATQTYKFLTLTERNTILQILHHFSLSVDSKDAEAAFTNLTVYNQLKNLYTPFHNFQLGLFAQRKQGQPLELPKNLVHLIGMYSVAGFSIQ